MPRPLNGSERTRLGVMGEYRRDLLGLTFFFGLFPIWGRCIKFSISTFFGLVLLLSIFKPATGRPCVSSLWHHASVYVRFVCAFMRRREIDLCAYVCENQCFMQDQNVACHDLGNVSFERAVGCFGKPQLERATRFPMPQLERATRFPMPQLERATRFPMSQLERAARFPNVPSRARDSLLNCQFKVCVFDCFCHSMPFICLNITSINYIN